MDRRRALLLLVACSAPLHSRPPMREGPDAGQPSAATIASTSASSARIASGPADPGEPDPGEDILEQEGFGALRFGMDAAMLRRRLGNPRRMTPPVFEHGTGEYAMVWSWNGVEVDLVSEHRSGPWRARRIEVSAPSGLATTRGIGVGSRRRAVMAAYPRGTGDDAWQVGGYAGIRFEIEHDIVVRMAIGVLQF